MHDRSQHLAATAAQQVRDFRHLLRELSSEQLALPCRGEKEGDTIGILIMRTTAVYDRLTTILDAVRQHQAPRAERGPRSAVRSAGPGRGVPPVTPDPLTLASRLEGRGHALVERLRALTAEQLARTLPTTVEGFDHMDKPIGMIVEYLLYCQADRFETIRRATAPGLASAHDVRLCWSSQMRQGVESRTQTAVSGRPAGAAVRMIPAAPGIARESA